MFHNKWVTTVFKNINWVTTKYDNMCDPESKKRSIDIYFILRRTCVQKT